MMFLHYLLVLLVVLLGNFQVISSDSESLPALEETLSEVLKVQHNQVQPSSSGNDEDSVFKGNNIQGKSHDAKATTSTLKVTDLHDPFNILDRINKTDTHHSHSITSEDFAQLTSLTDKTVKDKSPSDRVLPILQDNGGQGNMSFLGTTVQDMSLDEYKSLHDLPGGDSTTTTGLVEGSEHSIQVTGLKITESTSDTVDSIHNIWISNSKPTVPVYTSEGYYDNVSSIPSEPYTNLNFSDVVSKAKDEIKTYSNEALMAWEDLKDRVSSDNEIYHVLNDYHDKIAISQAANKSECVEVHVERYERRMRFLKDMMQSCESRLERKEWHELQNKTKEVLSAIHEIVRVTDLAKENLQKDSVEYYASVKWIENEGKRKLQMFDIDSKKKALSDLKKIALNADEDDYRDCIIRNTGHEIVVDTLNDIMKIKNNCVG